MTELNSRGLVKGCIATALIVFVLFAINLSFVSKAYADESKFTLDNVYITQLGDLHADLFYYNNSGHDQAAKDVGWCTIETSPNVINKSTVHYNNGYLYAIRSGESWRVGVEYHLSSDYHGQAFAASVYDPSGKLLGTYNIPATKEPVTVYPVTNDGIDVKDGYVDVVYKFTNYSDRAYSFKQACAYTVTQCGQSTKTELYGEYNVVIDPGETAVILFNVELKDNEHDLSILIWPGESYLYNIDQREYNMLNYAESIDTELPHEHVWVRNPDLDWVVVEPTTYCEGYNEWGWSCECGEDKWEGGEVLPMLDPEPDPAPDPQPAPDDDGDDGYVSVIPKTGDNDYSFILVVLAFGALVALIALAQDKIERN